MNLFHFRFYLNNILSSLTVPVVTFETLSSIVNNVFLSLTIPAIPAYFVHVHFHPKCILKPLSLRSVLVAGLLLFVNTDNLRDSYHSR